MQHLQSISLYSKEKQNSPIREKNACYENEINNIICFYSRHKITLVTYEYDWNLFSDDKQ